jgi:hypothetical protein
MIPEHEKRIYTYPYLAGGTGTDNDFAARAAYCHGYDVYGEMLGNATWPV